MFETREEWIEFIYKHNCYTYKEIKNLTGMSISSVNYHINTKHKLKLKHLKRDRIFFFLDNEKTLEEISKIMNIPIPTIYRYYKEYKEKEFRKKKNINIVKYTKLLKKYKFSLNKIYVNEGISPDKMRKTMKDLGIYEWYLKFKKERPKHKRKKGELKKIAFDFFDKFPNALNRTGHEIGLVLDCGKRDANRLRFLYKKEKGLL